MQSNFDKNFESHKLTFKQKFGIEWSANHQLYLTYLQTLYISSLTEVSNNGLGQILSRQDEMHRLLQSISQKLDKK
jgi:hypothetical protein